MNRSVLTASLLLPVVLAGGCARPQSVVVTTAGSPYGEEGLRVTGNAVVRSKPEYAAFNLGFSSTGPTALAAKQANSEVMSGVLKALRDQGVEEKDVQTIEYSIWSEQVWVKKKPHTVWHTDNKVSVKVRKVDTVSAVIDAATRVGANSLGSIQFLVEDMNALKEKARGLAAEAARKKAEQLAEKLGGKLGRLVAVYDGAIPWGYGNAGFTGWSANASLNYDRRMARPQDLEAPKQNGDEEQAEQTVSEGQIKVVATETAVYQLE